MSQRSNAEIIRIVEKYQEAGVVHELTCRVDSRHVALAPVEMDGKVVLLCPTCRSVQDDIPEQVLDSEAHIDFQLRLFIEARAQDDLRRRRADIWWTVAMFMIMATFLPGLVWGTTAMLGGFLASALVMAVYAWRRLRTIAADEPDDEA